MSVLIKGMKMPKGCHSGCPLTDSDAFTCEITGRNIVWDDEDTITCRPSWCPLVEVPSAEPVKHEECEYIITKGKAGYHEEYKCSVCGDSFYWTHDKMFPNKFNYCRNCGRKIVKFIDESED